MDRPIGYYVHHQGDGHRQRAVAIARQAQGRVILLGTGLAGRSEGVDFVELADDRLADGFDKRDGVERPRALHYAPIGHDGVRARVARIAGWIARSRPALMVVDVSVEVAMLARLASTPTVYVRLSGRRCDRPHLEAFRNATALLAPFHAALDDTSSDRIRGKTFYAPGLTAKSAIRNVQGDLVLGVVGEGGGLLSDGDRWAAAARAAPHMRWCVIGRCDLPADLPANLELTGWVDDAADRVAGAAVVVGAAGDGLVGAVIAAARPYVCIPQARPFDEQMAKASRLAALGAAVVCEAWPTPQAWPGVLERALTLDTAVLTGLGAADGAQRAVDWLIGVADGNAGPPGRRRDAVPVLADPLDLS